VGQGLDPAPNRESVKKKRERKTRHSSAPTAIPDLAQRCTEILTVMLQNKKPDACPEGQMPPDVSFMAGP
jgi:hypothetical protein